MQVQMCPPPHPQPSRSRCPPSDLKLQKPSIDARLHPCMASMYGFHVIPVPPVGRHVCTVQSPVPELKPSQWAVCAPFPPPPRQRTAQLAKHVKQAAANAANHTSAIPAHSMPTAAGSPSQPRQPLATSLPSLTHIHPCMYNTGVLYIHTSRCSAAAD